MTLNILDPLGYFLNSSYPLALRLLLEYLPVPFSEIDERRGWLPLKDADLFLFSAEALLLQAKHLRSVIVEFEP